MDPSEEFCCSAHYRNLDARVSCSKRRRETLSRLTFPLVYLETNTEIDTRVELFPLSIE
jgi:hypothetical protein